jgi:16S rRNA (cytidine1402-2'-O)-methyltransferase
MLELVKALPFTLVLYEAPHRLTETLDDLLAVLGDRTVTLCRELTKVHEEVCLTTLSELCRRFRAEKPLGEFTLVVEGATMTTLPVDDATIDETLQQLLGQGWSVKEAAKEIARRFGIARSQAYRRALQIRRKT